MGGLYFSNCTRLLVRQMFTTCLIQMVPVAIPKAVMNGCFVQAAFPQRFGRPVVKYTVSLYCSFHLIQDLLILILLWCCNCVYGPCLVSTAPSVSFQTFCLLQLIFPICNFSMAIDPPSSCLLLPCSGTQNSQKHPLCSQAQFFLKTTLIHSHCLSPVLFCNDWSLLMPFVHFPSLRVFAHAIV